MTILKDGDRRQLECESCPTTTDVHDADDFEIMIQAAREAGWKITTVKGEWVHYCPGCKHGDRLAAARKKFFG